LIVIKIIALLAQLSPLVLFFVFFKRTSKIVTLRVVFLYAVTSLASVFLLGAFQNDANDTALIFSISAMAEYVFFAILLYLCIRNKKFKNLIIVASVLALGIDLFLFRSPKSNSIFWPTLITAVLIVLYSIFFFYEQVNSPQSLLIYQSYQFWIVVGCIIYLSGTLFLFLITSDIQDKQKNSLWIINVLFEIVKNVFFSIALIVASNNKQNIISPDFDDTNILEKPF